MLLGLSTPGAEPQIEKLDWLLDTKHSRQTEGMFQELTDSEAAKGYGSTDPGREILATT
jgi:hypothetical protein